MATPYNAPYKVAQRKAKEAVRNRGEVLWVSSQVVEQFGLNLVKRKVQGTRIGSFAP